MGRPKTCVPWLQGPENETIRVLTLHFSCMVKKKSIMLAKVRCPTSSKKTANSDTSTEIEKTVEICHVL